MPTPNQKLRFRDTTSMAGWLFADLFLGLIVVFMATAQVPPKMGPSPTPTFYETLTSIPSPSITPKPLPSVPVSTSLPPGLDVQPFTFNIEIFIMPDFLARNEEAIQDFIRQVDKKLGGKKTQKAGLVITLGYHRQISVGLQLAQTANDLLISKFPNTFSSATTVTKSFWYTSDEIHPSGTLRFEIYFYTQ